MKKLTSIIIAVLLAVLLLSTCGIAGASSSSLKVYMPVGYIDETVLEDFQKEFQVQVELVEFDSNEEMYESIKNGFQYDILVPSDYMVDRLIQEGLLTKLDPTKLPYTSYIARQYMNPPYDPGNSYQIPYMVGTLGILYNRRALQISSWADLFGAKDILMVDSERDVVGAALKMLGYSMNSVEDSEIEAARQALQKASGNVRGYYESTEIVDIIAAQEARAGMVYSGDGKLAVDLNPNLAYIIPEEGSNRWTDSFCIPANAKHTDMAHAFINFMCRPNIAIRNMSELGYTSPIAEIWGEFAGNPYMFPSDEELLRCEVFTHSRQIAQKHGKVYSDIR